MVRNVCLGALTGSSTMLAFAGFQTAPKVERAKSFSTDIRAIDAVRNQFAAAYNSNGAEAVAAHLADDVVLMLPNQPTLAGKRAIQATLEDFFKQNAVKVKHNSLETQVGGDWDDVRGNITETLTPKSRMAIEKSLKISCNPAMTDGRIVEGSPGYGQHYREGMEPSEIIES